MEFSVAGPWSIVVLLAIRSAVFMLIVAVTQRTSKSLRPIGIEPRATTATTSLGCCL